MKNLKITWHLLPDCNAAMEMGMQSFALNF